MEARFTSVVAFADWLISSIRRFGLEYVANRYYGTYLGVVEDVVDPENRGRVRIRIPALAHRSAPADLYARPVFPGSANGHGMFFPPVVGDQVWVQFEGGDPGSPLYIGGFIAREKRPEEFASEVVRGIKTPFGHYIRWSDDPDDPHVRIQMSKDESGTLGGFVFLGADGSVLAENGNGSSVHMDATDGSVTVSAEGGSMITMPSNGSVLATSSAGDSVELSSGITVIGKGKITVETTGSVEVKGATVTLGTGPLKEGVVLDSFVKQIYNNHTHQFIGNMGAPGVTLPPLTMLGIPGVNTSTKVKAVKG